MKITPIDIKTQNFTRSLRGYDAEEVKAFLEKLAAEVEELMNENETLIEEINELKTSLDGYKKIEKDLETKLLKAQDSSTKSIETAKNQTGMILKEAELKAADIIEKAKLDANEIRDSVNNLKEERDLIISKLKAIVNTQSTLLEGKVKNIDKEQQETEKTKQQQMKDDFDVDVDDIVNKLL
jgi:cell division initiation protein